MEQGAEDQWPEVPEPEAPGQVPEAPAGLHRGGTSLNTSTGEGMEKSLNDARELDEEALKKAGHAKYMRFYRSLRSPNCPAEMATEYAEAKGRPGLTTAST